MFGSHTKFANEDLSLWIPTELQEDESPEGFESEQEGLNLNVWTPQTTESDGIKRPVLFYVCGQSVFATLTSLIILALL